MNVRFAAIITGLALMAACLPAAPLSAQDIDVRDGVRYIKNDDPKWGDEPAISLELVQQFGSLESDDENYFLFKPIDVAVDADGNVFVLDSGNYRIQKFSPDGEYLDTMGRQGQGPGEFSFPSIMQITGDKLYVSDVSGMNILIKVFNTSGEFIENKNADMFAALAHFMEDGRRIYSGLPINLQTGEMTGDIIHVYSASGEEIASFGEPVQYDNPQLQYAGNMALFDVEGEDIYLSYATQNKIEKYTLEGKKYFEMTRELGYDLGVRTRSMSMTINGQKIEQEVPEPVPASKSIEIGPDGNIWVLGFTRLEREDEKIDVNDMTVDDTGNFSFNFSAKSDEMNTDLHELQVFAPDGVLLGAVPIELFADRMRIFGDRLYIVDMLRSMSVYEYRIVTTSEQNQ